MPTFVPGWKKHTGQGILRKTTSGKFVAEFNSDGIRRRKTFGKQSQAVEWLKGEGAIRRDDGKDVISLTGSEQKDALAAIALLRNRVISSSLLECARTFAEDYRGEGVGALQEWHQKRLQYLKDPQDGSDSARRSTIHTAQTRISTLLELFGDRDVTDISKSDIQEWLNYTGAEGRNLLNYKVEAQSLFNFIQRETSRDDDRESFANRVARFPQKKRKKQPQLRLWPPVRSKPFY